MPKKKRGAKDSSKNTRPRPAYYVYVIELDDAVGKRVRADKPAVYVGQSAVAPEEVIPHFIVLAFLWIAVFFVVIVAWFAILFTRRYPRGIFDFVEGVVRWGQRVVAYAFTLVTDRYPPFSLRP